MLPCNSAICSLPFQPAPSGSSARDDKNLAKVRRSKKAAHASGPYRLRCTACKEVAICRNPITAPTLGPDAALDDCLGDTPDGDNVCRSAIVTAVLLGSVVNLVKRLHHRLLQPAVYFGLVPEELLQVLYPFEIGDSHTAGIGENVGQHHHLFTAEHEVGFWCRRAVGGFGDDLGPDVARILNFDLVFPSTGDQI